MSPIHLVSLISILCSVGAVTAIAAEPIKATQAAPGAVQPVSPAPKEIRSSSNGEPRVFAPRVPDAALLEELKAAAAKGAGGRRAAPEPELKRPRSTSINLNKPGLAADNSSSTPPDSTGTIGPSHYLEAVNSGGIAVYSRTKLSKLAQTPLDTFVGFDVSLSNDDCDPQVQWDPQANRFLYAAIRCDRKTPNLLFFGWTKTNSPLPLPSSTPNGVDSPGNWCRFQINTGTFLDDYPKLGHNDNHMVIGTNVFDSTDTFQSSRIWAIAKPATGDTSCATPNVFFFGGPSPSAPLVTQDGNFAFTPVPANTISGGLNAYVVAADTPFFVSNPSQLMVWHVTGPKNAPVLTADGNINVDNFAMPANIPQPGTSNLIDASDTRLTQSVAALDPDFGNKMAVWTQHTVAGSGGRSEVHWYEITPGLCSAGTCPTKALRRAGVISSSTLFVFNAAVSPTLAGNTAAIQFNVGSSTVLPEIHVRTRKSTDSKNAMPGGDKRLGTSVAFDQDFSCTASTPCRWGDYSALNPDPTNQTQVWGTNMAVGAQNGTHATWTTRNFSVSP